MTFKGKRYFELRSQEGGPVSGVPTEEVSSEAGFEKKGKRHSEIKDIIQRNVEARNFKTVWKNTSKQQHLRRFTERYSRRNVD